MKKIILLSLLALPYIASAQRQYSEYYWVYYTVDSSLYVEREFKYGGYQDYVQRTILTERRAAMDDSTRATSTAERITSAPKDKIFRFNPAKENRVFPRQHPYFPKGCGGCNKGIGSKNLAYDPNNPQCQACKAIAECERKMPIGTQKDSYKNILEYGKKNIIGKVSYTNKAFKGKTAIFTRQSVAHNLGYGELFYAKVDVLNNIKDYLSDIKNLQRVKIEHNEKGNIAAMYEATVKYKGNDTFGKNRDMLLQFKEFVDGTLIFYFIKFI